MTSIKHIKGVANDRKVEGGSGGGWKGGFDDGGGSSSNSKASNSQLKECIEVKYEESSERKRKKEWKKEKDWGRKRVSEGFFTRRDGFILKRNTQR